MGRNAILIAVLAVLVDAGPAQENKEPRAVTLIVTEGEGVRPVANAWICETSEFRGEHQHFTLPTAPIDPSLCRSIGPSGRLLLDNVAWNAKYLIGAPGRVYAGIRMLTEDRTEKEIRIELHRVASLRIIVSNWRLLRQPGISLSLLRMGDFRYQSYGTPLLVPMPDQTGIVQLDVLPPGEFRIVAHRGASAHHAYVFGETTVRIDAGELRERQVPADADKKGVVLDLELTIPKSFGPAADLPFELIGDDDLTRGIVVPVRVVGAEDGAGVKVHLDDVLPGGWSLALDRFNWREHFDVERGAKPVALKLPELVEFSFDVVDETTKAPVAVDTLYWWPKGRPRFGYLEGDEDFVGDFWIVHEGIFRGAPGTLDRPFVFRAAPGRVQLSASAQGYGWNWKEVNLRAGKGALSPVLLERSTVFQPEHAYLLRRVLMSAAKAAPLELATLKLTSEPKEPGPGVARLVVDGTKNTGFLFEALMKVVAACERSDPRVRVAAIDFGSGDPGYASGISKQPWRLKRFELEAAAPKDPNDRGRPVAVLEDFVKVLQKSQDDGHSIDLATLRVANGAVHWSMSVATVAARDAFVAALTDSRHFKSVQTGVPVEKDGRLFVGDGAASRD